MKYIISESEKSYILGLYGISHNEPTPLEKLSSCKYTSNGKYIYYENTLYSCETGKEILLNEAWTLSDILHAGADLVSAGLDFVIPGSGAVVDTLNGLSYLIESQFKNSNEKSALYIMAAITFGFVVMPGAFQTMAIPLKRAIQTGGNFNSPLLIEGIKMTANVIDKITSGLPNAVKNALASPLAQKILGRWGSKINGIVDNFTRTAKNYFNELVATNIANKIKDTNNTVSKTTAPISKQTQSINNPLTPQNTQTQAKTI